MKKGKIYFRNNTLTIFLEFAQIVFKKLKLNYNNILKFGRICNIMNVVVVELLKILEG